MTVRKDNNPPGKFHGEGAFFLLISIFIIHENEDLTLTLFCCHIRAEALFSLFWFKMCTEC